MRSLEAWMLASILATCEILLQFSHRWNSAFRPREKGTERESLHAIVKYELLALIGGQGNLSTSGRLRVYLAWLTDY